MVTTFIIAILWGLFIGIMAGLLGIGGGALMVPLYRLGFGMTALGATGTSIFTIIPTSCSGAVTHIRGKTCVPKLSVCMGLGGAMTSPLGVYLATLAPSWAVMAGTACMMIYSSGSMIRKALQANKDYKQGKEEPAELEPIKFTPKIALIGVCIGLVTGVVSGFIGVGGGFIMIPVMMNVLNIPARLSSGTSLIAIMILAIPGAITQGMLGNINFVAGIAVALGSVPGASIGARFIRRVPERTLRIVFAIFVTIVAILLVVKEIAFA